MGQSPINCDARPATPRDKLAYELSIYRWRANPNSNTFVSRVYFKNAYAQKQQQKFAEFIQLQQKDDYLQIYKFKQQVQDYRPLSNEQIIVFEKYYCNLGQLHNRLNIQAVMYVMHGLLFGFEQLRKIYDKIIINQQCCFVTNEGEVRAWINPNPKSNQVWSGYQGQFNPEKSLRQTLLKIINICEKISIRNQKIQDLFEILRLSLDKQSQKNINFAEMRKILNEFCYLNSIEMGKNLIHLLKNKSNDSNSRKSYKRQQRNTQSGKRQKQNIVYMQTEQSQSNLHNKQLLARSKSMENKQLFALNLQQKDRKQSNIKTKTVQIKQNPHLSNVFQTVSHIYPQKNQSIRNSHSGIIKSSLWDKQTKNKSIKDSSYICSDGFFKNDISKQQIIEVDSGHSNSSHHATKVSQVMGNMPINISINRPIQSQMKKQQRRTKVQDCMHASIIQRMEQQSKNMNQRALNHHKTCIDRQSFDQSNHSANWSRPWITTKTITKLISDNQSSMKNSIAESDDFYNSSIYSGPLTNFGRDIAGLNVDRTKTVRISRNL